ncbi:MAG TPA: Gfo/Idh/MocA family oxidoreductase [Planctomycetes bacterium]|nr:Gfo/Idh/MocA family oxidoreductase [Fuerstiella sp.]HIK93207.1 Gfo/Idh/MocA family oxidoreductase [Planctomycetota bacterium]
MSQVTRRSFVKTATAAGAAFTAAPAIGRAGTSANAKIGMCVVGVNSRGNSHIGGWLEDERSEVRAIVDVDEAVGNKRCDQIEGKQGLRPKLYTDMRKAFEDDSIDGISTATPNHWHALCGIWAMQAGKDAYVEKPVCHNVHEGTALIAAARKYKRMCQVGTQSRSSSAVQDAVAFLESGGIGTCNFARGLCYKRRASINPLGDYPLPEGVDFDLWSGPAQFTDPKLTRKRFHYDWHWQRMYGNGDLGNQGPHQTDIARWGLGVDTHPTSILTYGGRLGYQAERKDPNYVDAGDTGNTEVSIYDYGDKTLVFETRGLDVSNSADEELNTLFQSTKGNKIGVVFYGSEGYLVQKTYSHCIAYDKDMNVIKEFKGGGNHFGNFLDACESRNVSDLNADVREGHLSAAISHLGNISYYAGENNKVTVEELSAALEGIKGLDDNQATLTRTVKHLEQNGADLSKYPIALGPLLKFDPEKELFTNNSAANQYLTREYREPYVCPTADRV